VPAEKLKRNLLGLASVECAHADCSAPAAVTDSTALEVEIALVSAGALRVQLVHHRGDVDPTVALRCQEKIVLLELWKRVEKRNLI
jgi:hypothetical protein